MLAELFNDWHMDESGGDEWDIKKIGKDNKPPKGPVGLVLLQLFAIPFYFISVVAFFGLLFVPPILEELIHLLIYLMLFAVAMLCFVMARVLLLFVSMVEERERLGVNLKQNLMAKYGLILGIECSFIMMFLFIAGFLLRCIILFVTRDLETLTLTISFLTLMAGAIWLYRFFKSR